MKEILFGVRIILYLGHCKHCCMNKIKIMHVLTVFMVSDSAYYICALVNQK